MRDGGIDRDDEVERCDQFRGVQEIPSVELMLHDVERRGPVE